MRTVREVIQNLLENGTNEKDGCGGEYDGSWDKCPLWPPDAFAVSSTLVEMTACFTHPSFGGWGKDSFFTSQSNKEDLEEIGEIWEEMPSKYKDEDSG
ncbi:MAG: hypothetical protein QM703_26005 [Gemmatales bacterium]